MLVKLQFESFYFVKTLDVRQREYLSLSQEIISVDSRMMSVLKAKCLNRQVKILEVELLDTSNTFGVLKKEILMRQNDLAVFRLELYPSDDIHWVVRYSLEDEEMECQLPIIGMANNRVVKVWLEPLPKELNADEFLPYLLKSEGADEVIYELTYDAEEWLIQGKTCGLLKGEEPILLCPLRRKDLILPSIICKCKHALPTIFEYPSNAQIIKIDC